MTLGVPLCLNLQCCNFRNRLPSLASGHGLWSTSAPPDCIASTCLLRYNPRSFPPLRLWCTKYSQRVSAAVVMEFLSLFLFNCVHEHTPLLIFKPFTLPHASAAFRRWGHPQEVSRTTSAIGSTVPSFLVITTKPQPLVAPTRNCDLI